MSLDIDHQSDFFFFFIIRLDIFIIFIPTSHLKGLFNEKPYINNNFKCQYILQQAVDVLLNDMMTKYISK